MRRCQAGTLGCSSWIAAVSLHCHWPAAEVHAVSGDRFDGQICFVTCTASVDGEAVSMHACMGMPCCWHTSKAEQITQYVTAVCSLLLAVSCCRAARCSACSTSTSPPSMCHKAAAWPTTWSRVMLTRHTRWHAWASRRLTGARWHWQHFRYCLARHQMCIAAQHHVHAGSATH